MTDAPWDEGPVSALRARITELEQALRMARRELRAARLELREQELAFGLRELRRCLDEEAKGL